MRFPTRTPNYAALLLTGMLSIATLAPEAAAQDRGGWWTPVVERQQARGETSRGGQAARDRSEPTRRERTTAQSRRSGAYPPSSGEYYRGGDRDEDHRGKSAKGGPAFCRSGAGHPVHGRQWCARKGYGSGGDYRYDDRRYDHAQPRMERRSRLEDILFGRRASESGVLSPRLLESLLGRGAYRLLDAERSTLGSRSPLEGRWVPTHDGAQVLQLRSGSLPVAELVDVDRDGRVDRTFVHVLR